MAKGCNVAELIMMTIARSPVLWELGQQEPANPASDPIEPIAPTPTEPTDPYPVVDPVHEPSPNPNPAPFPSPPEPIPQYPPDVTFGGA